jgi:lipid-A-disaccharide synthase
MRLLISAGEASGEAYGAQLIAALRGAAPEAVFFGLGGQAMRAAGCDTVVDARDVAVVGLAEVVTHLPRIYGEFRKLLRAVDAQKPDAAILIDFPDFNFRLARQLHRRGVPVFYYISPQLWAWRAGRIRLVRQYVRKMLVIFPFEEQWYRERGVEAVYVGHPLADIPPPSISRDNFAARHGLDVRKQWIALLPGSRQREVRMNLPGMLSAAARLSSEYEYVLPVASTLDPAWVRQLAERDFGDMQLRYSDDARATLLHARAAIVASGTATVEAALMGTPFVMVYRVSRLTWALGRHLVKVPHFAMVNLIAGREVVPEIVQADFTPARVAESLARIIADGAERQAMLDGLGEVRRRLRHSNAAQPAAAHAAEVILNSLNC